ncbi:hypothetical protein [Legionella micdadei]|uniref:Uncharacterized protein n=1 Tax=Legionella micdadei TaxID=451 RepID=A0A098GG00_LEGMI|nr:hypothetical protein [Legionella micdadei]ARG97530.1 hypothetical protein B6N58_07535 [Legionella micdadei]ARH00160.1 hypothetical protein B6V88_06885 [Legionella micdadei]KTD27603.1 hypothetical protein Lmic_1923 [Legionella micdadei]NSL17585.1 hypothetical protein [Legionella micdadei]CEG60912.1 conserved protein of unknown function [Legionella micdadei]
MERKQLIQTLVTQFEEQIRSLPEQKLKDLESGKLEISLTQAVGKEAGGKAASTKYRKLI